MREEKKNSHGQAHSTHSFRFTIDTWAQWAQNSMTICVQSVSPPWKMTETPGLFQFKPLRNEIHFRCMPFI